MGKGGLLLGLLGGAAALAFVSAKAKASAGPVTSFTVQSGANGTMNTGGQGASASLPVGGTWVNASSPSGTTTISPGQTSPVQLGVGTWTLNWLDASDNAVTSTVTLT